MSPLRNANSSLVVQALDRIDMLLAKGVDADLVRAYDKRADRTNTFKQLPSHRLRNGAPSSSTAWLSTKSRPHFWRQCIP